MKVKLNNVVMICAATLAAMFAVVSCTKPSSGETADSEFKIRSVEIAKNEGSQLSANAVKMGAAGGQITFEYDIVGPRVGNIAEVKCEENYVKVGRVYQTGFTVTVDPNETGADRVARIEMSGSGVKPLIITVLQSKESTSEEVYKNYKVEISDVTSFSAKFKVIPVDPTLTYSYSVVRKSDYDKVGKDAYIEAIISQIKQYAAISGSPLNSFLVQNTMTDSQTSYRDDTEYYVVLFDLSFDASGAASYSGEVELKSFKTEKAAQTGTTFSLSINGSRMIVSPSDASTTYVCDVLTKEAWDELGNPVDAAWTYITTMRSYNSLTLLRGVYNADISESLDVKGTQYVAFAVGYRDDADDKGLSTEVKYEIFTY